MKAERQSNIELLRIFSMLLIITTHFWGHCIDLAAIEPFADGYILGWFAKGVSYICVNSYVIISAYFLCKSTFKFKKLVILWLQVEFYSVGIFLIGLITGVSEFSFMGLIKALLPVLSSEYWFATVYVGLYILSPFINKFIYSLSKGESTGFICILFVLFVLIPNIFSFSSWLNFGTGYGIVWFFVLYVIGAHIRLHVDIEKIKTKKKLLLAAAVVLLMLPGISRMVIAFIGVRLWGSDVGAGLFYSNNSILILPATVITFLAFLSCDVKSEKTDKVINTLAKGSFGVYLIHENPNISNFLWDAVRARIDLSSPFLFLQFVGVVLVIWFVCTIIDLLRLQLFKPIISSKIFNRITSPKSPKIVEKIIQKYKKDVQI